MDWIEYIIISRNLFASFQKNIYWNISREFLDFSKFPWSFSKYSNLVWNFLNQYFYNLAQTFFRLREMLHKRSHYHYGEGFWNFSEIFCEWFGRTQTFHEMFWQVCGNIYWNILRKLLVKILETLHKILQKLFWKVSRNTHISVTNFLNQRFHNLAEIFSVKSLF